ncbi:unnamed protein product, partial [Durusdinium trenchii]
ALQFKAMEVLEGSLQQVGVGELAILTNGFQLFRSSTAMFEQLTKLREFAKGNKARLAAEEFDKFCAKVTNEGFDVASLSFAELDVCVSEMKDMDEDKSVKMVSLVPVVLRALKHQVNANSSDGVTAGSKAAEIVAKRLKAGALSQYMTLAAEIATTGMALRDFVSNIPADGDAASRIAKDASGQLLSSILLSCKRLWQQLEKARLVEADQPGTLKGELSFVNLFDKELESDLWLDMCKLQMAKAKESLNLALAEFKKISKGYSEESTSWKKDVTEAMEVKAVIEIAEKSILCMP